MSTVDELGVGMVGYAFMGAAHSQAWRSVNRFFDVPVRVRMAALCGRSPDRAAAARDKLGWESAETDWHALIARDDIHIIDVCTPGDSHAEIAIAALRAGKHVLCEKPLANSVEEAAAMAQAATEAARSGVYAMCGFTYRRVPAVALMAQLVAQGKVGQLRHVRAVYLQDWLVDPQSPLTWRLQAEHAGLGALGDIGSHIVDLVQYVTGERVAGVSGMTETFVTRRPLPSGSPQQAGALSSGPATAVDATQTGPVTVDDAAVFLGRLAGGALATFEASRFATGRKNGLRVEINGSAGTLAFDLERLNELSYYDASAPTQVQGFTRILVTEPQHPYVAAWWPPGHLLGYEHAFTHQARDFLDAIATGTEPRPSFTDALDVQRVLSAVVHSATNGTQWIDVTR